ncbi:lysophospholipid acyltransferase LPCAT4 isoform X2 [Syngnathoides biaculeatus]|uniref:lysophospholipid acyltransferase LPCAT4 isoform X2 n=1 Tax=Syngnathoides biaculeatus TaxID=300417 RepID=UPI002ADDAA52|nr:lysophospholipid acyltransferase LPCAT4 isoform X2 [Syngnathoides biaculeatus]
MEKLERGVRGSHQGSDNPFYHKVTLSGFQRIRGLILGSFLFPVRIVLVSLFFLLMWPLARLRLAGLSAEDRARPVTGWRRWFFHPGVWLLSRAVFFSLGFVWVRVKGRRADLVEAPVLVVAPHSTFLDMLVLCTTQLPTVVSRSENTSLPVIGALLEFNQSVLVSRSDPDSRKKAVAQLTERITSNGYWPQMLMFPEGTTTNGSALIKFKPGAFLCGVPVQPVLLRYPNKLDTVRWSYKGTTWLEALWHTSSQLYTNITVEFLPVYKPSPEERNDPILYADNVQKLMAKALGIPATDYVMQGGVPVQKVGGLSLPIPSPGREALALLRKAGLGASEVEAALGRMVDRCRSGSSFLVGAEELAAIFGLSDGRTAASVCGLYSKEKVVDPRQIYLNVAALSGLVNIKPLLHTAFDLYDGEGTGSLSAEELSDLMGALLGLRQHHTAQLYAEASSGGRLSRDDLVRTFTSHPTYQKVASDHLQPGQAACQSLVNSNGNLLNGNKKVI